MPANVVRTPAEKKAWERAKEIFQEQKGRAPGDEDWPLVMHIYKNVLESKKTAALAHSLIRVAYYNPEIRQDVLPLLSDKVAVAPRARTKADALAVIQTLAEEEKRLVREIMKGRPHPVIRSSKGESDALVNGKEWEDGVRVLRRLQSMKWVRSEPSDEDDDKLLWSLTPEAESLLEKIPGQF